MSGVVMGRKPTGGLIYYSAPRLVVGNIVLVLTYMFGGTVCQTRFIVVWMENSIRRIVLMVVAGLLIVVLMAITETLLVRFLVILGIIRR